MPDKKISQLAEVTSLLVDDVFTIVRAGDASPNKRIKPGAVFGTMSVNVKSAAYGARGDTIVVTDGAVTNGSDLLTCATSTPFTPSHVGKTIDLNQSGAAFTDIHGVAQFNNQVGTIISYVSPSQVHLSFSAARTATGLQVVFGTDDSAAIQAARTAAASIGGGLYFPPGKYIQRSQLTAASGMAFFGDGKGVSVVYMIGPIPSSIPSHFKLIAVPNGTVKFSVRNLSLLGTNRVGAQADIGGGIDLSYGVHIGAGASGGTATIDDLSFIDCEISHVYGMGMRNDGDAEQSGLAPSVINIKIVNTDVSYNSDNGVNVNTGGGLWMTGCKIRGNGAGGAEIAASRPIITDCEFSENRGGGITIGGVGNPSVLRDIIFLANRVEHNGRVDSGAGIALGGNVVHGIIGFNTVRLNAASGIVINDGPPDFATLTNDIRIFGNKVCSNGWAANTVNSFGIYTAINDVVIEHNDVFNEGIAGYSQYTGIYVLAGSGAQIHHNRVYGHTASGRDLILDGINMSYINEHPGTVAVSDTFALYTGMVDTSAGLVTWKSGALFPLGLKSGQKISINAVSYVVSTVPNPPLGTVNVTGGVNVTRVTGDAFSALWVGKHITIQGVNYIIAAVADASHLTITISYNTPLDMTGAPYSLLGIVSLTVTPAAGIQAGVNYGLPPSFTMPILVAPMVQPVLATGTGKTVDDVIALLQTLGLCKQA